MNRNTFAFSSHITETVTDGAIDGDEDKLWPAAIFDGENSDIRV